MKIIKCFLMIWCVFSISLLSAKTKENQSGTSKENVDRRGFDIRVLEYTPPKICPPGQKCSSIDEGKKSCKDECDKETECKAWTYVKAARSEKGVGKCYLKNSVPPETTSSCCFSGTKFEENTDRYGGDYSQITGIPLYNLSTKKTFNLPITEQLCHTLCEGDDKCMAWTFVKPNTIQGPKPNCWLKDKVPNAQPNPCCTSGHFSIQD